jgi:hypothetical protein
MEAIFNELYKKYHHQLFNFLFYSLNSVVPTKGYFQTLRMQAEKMMPKVNYFTSIPPKYISNYSNLEDQLIIQT